MFIFASRSFLMKKCDKKKGMEKVHSTKHSNKFRERDLWMKKESTVCRQSGDRKYEKMRTECRLNFKAINRGKQFVINYFLVLIFVVIYQRLRFNFWVINSPCFGFRWCKCCISVNIVAIRNNWPHLCKFLDHAGNCYLWATMKFGKGQKKAEHKDWFCSGLFLQYHFNRDIIFNGHFPLVLKMCGFRRKEGWQLTFSHNWVEIDFTVATLFYTRVISDWGMKPALSTTGNHRSASAETLVSS